MLNAYQPAYGGYADYFISKFFFDSRSIGEISLNRGKLNFAIRLPGAQTISKYFYIRYTGELPLAWNVAASDSWLSCSPTNGAGNAKVAVSVNASGLAPGVYRGVITVNAPDAVNSPQAIDVTLAVHTAGTDVRPSRLPFE